MQLIHNIRTQLCELCQFRKSEDTDGNLELL